MDAKTNVNPCIDVVQICTKLVSMNTEKYSLLVFEAIVDTQDVNYLKDFYPKSCLSRVSGSEILVQLQLFFFYIKINSFTGSTSAVNIFYDSGVYLVSATFATFFWSSLGRTSKYF